MKDSYYKPSGRIEPIYYLYYLILVIIGIPLLGTAYIYLAHYVPFIYANVFVAVGCGVALGNAIGFIAKAGKARNPIVVLVCALAAMCVLKYVQWCIYIPLVFTDVYGIWDITFGERFVESFSFFIQPSMAYEAATFINRYGSWSVDVVGSNSANAVSGVPLLVVWIGEFVAMAAAAVTGVWRWPRLPFSEEANGWYTKKDRSIEADIADDFGAMKSSMESGNFTELVQHAKAGKTDGANFMRIAFFQPPQDSYAEPYYLTIVQHTTGKRNKNRAKTLVEYLAIDARTVSEMAAQAAFP